jgi:phage shock protein PspC (stress-responsive transcriptional regulator)
MIAGVCKGVADHFRVEPVLVRIGFVVASFFGGAGLIAYAAAWAFVPEEGEDRSIGERVMHERRWGRIAGIVLIAIAVSSLARPFWWFGGHAVFAILLIMGGLYLLSPAFTSSPADERERACIGGPTESANAQTSVMTEPVPPSPPVARRRRRGGLGALTFGVLFVGSGIIGLVLAAGGTVEPTYVFATGLIVVGIALVISTWIGRSFVLIPLGVLLAGLMSISTVIDVPITGGVGERHETPLSLTDLKGEYHLGIGELQLDLSHVDFRREPVRTVHATVGIGHLQVRLPPGVVAELHGHAGMGEVRFLDDHDGGIRVHRDTTLTSGGEGAGRVIVELEVGIGQAEVIDAAA